MKIFRKVVKLLSIILIPAVLTYFLLGVYSNYLDQQIDNLYSSLLGKTYGVDEMNKGIKLLKHNADKDDLIILGSSELDANVPESPQYMIPNTELNCDVDLVGRAVVQNLANAMKVGALKDSFKEKKIVLIVSLQWFLGDDIELSGFKAHFSEIQFYKFMKNKNISDEHKMYVCNRIVELLKNDSKFERPYLYAKLYKNKSFWSNAAFTLFKPYYLLRESFLDLRDKHQSLKAVNRFKGSNGSDVIDVNWDEEESKAQKLGEESCTNNDFYVLNSYYDTYLRDKIDSLKNSSDPNLDLCKSKEFDDYRLLLEIFKQSEVKPYIVFMSTNGRYYDYIGLDKEKRDNFYDKLKNIVDEYGFSYLDLRDKEYEPYFYKDVMHLGWRGWLYVNKKITEYYS